MAPILPHLAQEIHDSMYYENKGLVFLEQPWDWREGGFAIKGFTVDDMKAVKKDSDDMAMLMQEVAPCCHVVAGTSSRAKVRQVGLLLWHG